MKWKVKYGGKDIIKRFAFCPDQYGKEGKLVAGI